ncbi:YeeE/YedE family protein [Vibrio rumoiensis]|uniref:Transporter n=1 Tax=Vibrio rumoiensis 1S-45 TaxID=1188252 RepID=A0A1E5E4K5_9VIBR|nr:YeeE/YedE family protein [Vibrio rumoiensis]OEF27625.1 transporter [Vibrio rumoiensis 1S-45]
MKSYSLASLFSGLLFGFGMVLSGMVDPDKVIGFLDVAGDWDPSLAFVMGGALLVFVPAYHLLIKPRQKPIDNSEFCIPNNKSIDKKLILGASLFGIGWGIAGVCPGPALASLSLMNTSLIAFVVSMLVGMLMVNLGYKTSKH